MAALHFIDDADVQETIEESAKAAVEVLDKMFPGFDAGGITSNFQGGLVEVLKSMLSGRPVTYRPFQSTSTPTLVLHGQRFRSAWCDRGEAFLAAQYQEDGSIKAISPSSGCLIPIASVDDAWTSSDAAADSIKDFARRNFDTVEGLVAAKFLIIPVEPIQNSEIGYQQSKIME